MGKTILISSHILTELADCCTSIGIIERGKLLMHGPIEEVYHRIRRNRIVRIRFLKNQEAGLSIVRSMPADPRRASRKRARHRRVGRRRRSRWPTCWRNSSPPACA